MAESKVVLKEINVKLFVTKTDFLRESVIFNFLRDHGWI